MRSNASALSRQCLTVCLVSILTAAGSDRDIRAEVQHVTATTDAAQDPDVTVFKLNFDLRLTNQSVRVVALPKAEGDNHETTRIAVLGAQFKHSDGSWTPLVQSSWYDVGATKYESCTSISPGETATFENVKSGLLLLKKQLANMGDNPTIRLSLMAFCRQADGKILTTAITTDDFALRLSR